MNEKHLINQYCKKLSSCIFFEVSIGDKNTFGKESTDRKIDIVLIHGTSTKKSHNYSEHKDLFLKMINKKNTTIEIIEAKKKLNRNLLGQILVADFMFKKKFKVNKLKKSVLYSVGDSALELFCKNNSINLIKQE